MSSPESSAKAAVKAEKREQRQKKSSVRYPFWFGGSASSMAACVTHPLDLGTFIISYPYRIVFMLTTMQSRYEARENNDKLPITTLEPTADTKPLRSGYKHAPAMRPRT